MQLKFYRLRELASVPARGDKPGRQGRLPVSGATIWRWTAAGQFPAPVKLNGTTAWPAEAVEAWELARQAVKPAGAKGQRNAAAASVAARRAKREGEAA